MIAKPLATRATTARPLANDPLIAVWQNKPLDTQERVQRIAALGQRINSYVQFMCEIASANNASGEAKDKVVAAFYEKLELVERQLCRIHDEFRLI
jgi:hypothetical protein